MRLLPWRRKSQIDLDGRLTNQQSFGDDASQNGPRFLGPPIQSGAQNDNGFQASATPQQVNSGQYLQQQANPTGFQSESKESHLQDQGAPYANRVPPANFNDHSTVLDGFPAGQTTSQEHRQDDEHASATGLENRHQFGPPVVHDAGHHAEDSEETQQVHHGQAFLGPPLKQNGNDPAYLGPPVHQNNDDQDSHTPKTHNETVGFGGTHKELPKLTLGGESIVTSGGNPLAHQNDVLKPWDEHETTEIAAGFNPTQPGGHQN